MAAAGPRVPQVRRGVGRGQAEPGGPKAPYSFPSPFCRYLFFRRAWRRRCRARGCGVVRGRSGEGRGGGPAGRGVGGRGAAGCGWGVGGGARGRRASARFPGSASLQLAGRQGRHPAGLGKGRAQCPPPQEVGPARDARRRSHLEAPTYAKHLGREAVEGLRARCPPGGGACGRWPPPPAPCSSPQRSGFPHRTAFVWRPGGNRTPLQPGAAHNPSPTSRLRPERRALADHVSRHKSRTERGAHAQTCGPLGVWFAPLAAAASHRLPVRGCYPDGSTFLPWPPRLPNQTRGDRCESSGR